MEGNLTIITVSFGDIIATRKTLLSIIQLGRKHTDLVLRVIIINGNPKFSFIQMLKDFRQLDIIYHEGNDAGTYDAMNIGISYLPDSGFCCFINSDDEIIDVPKNLFRSKHDAYFCDVLSFDEPSGLVERFSASAQNNVTPYEFLRFKVHHQGFIVRCEVLRTLYYDLEVGIRADYLIMLQTLMTYHTSTCNKVVARITTGGQSDVYSAENFMSFLRVARKLKISIFLVLICSFPFILKYSVKGFLGKNGVTLVRYLKKRVRKSQCS